MDYIQIVLVVYLFLRIIDFFPNKKFILNNPVQNFILTILLILLASMDSTVCLLVVIAILVNLNNESVETLFTEISNREMDEIKKTLLNPTKTSIQTKCPLKNIHTALDTSKNQITIEEEEDKCIPEFIISKEMLINAQNNIFDMETFDKYINETHTEGVNIQGVFDDITGYNIQ